MQNKTFLTDLVCTGCGNVAQIRRKSKRLKGVGHIKDLWCYRCEMVTKHFEVRDISKFIYDEDMSFELEGLKEDERRGKVLKKVLEKENLTQGLEELSRGRSVQYIVGNVDFYGNIIHVDERVLIPRFETELLVEKTAEFIKQIFENGNIRIVDLGTGSGCIAISLKKLFMNSEVYGIDKSLDALKCASYNATENNVNINFSYGDMAEFRDMSFDVYISNPPYIAYDEEIMDVVKDNEPEMALYAPDKGLFYYKKIIENLCKLKGKFLIAFEIGEKQADSIVNIIFKYFTNVTICIEKDYNKRDRFIFVYRN